MKDKITESLNVSVSLNAIQDVLNEKVLNSRAYNHSAWNRGVNEYVNMIMFELSENGKNSFENIHSLRAAMLNGSKDWKRYSYGGMALVYNGDIAETLCTKSELKRYENGQKEPGKNRLWIDVQTDALKQAAGRIENAYYTAYLNASAAAFNNK